ncbi:pyroglutamyl-peptidase I family protein [Myxosarcina sp. GI1(2024)]
MKNKLLLTSFQTWLDRQEYNSSDRLLATVEEWKFPRAELVLLRRLPVDTQLASQKAIAAIEAIQPQGIICCGMAESRQYLTIESNATCRDDCIYTQVDLEKLIEQLFNTTVSDDAGKFVCEGLYYQILSFLRSVRRDLPCIFVHVPLLTEDNLSNIERDFKSILQFVIESGV